MSFLQNKPILTAALTVLAITTFVYYTSCAPAAVSYSTMATSNTHDNHPSLSHLHVSLSQSTTSPPTLSLRVQNTHPSRPISLLTWESPLDPLALQLGLIEITPLGNDDDNNNNNNTPLPLASIKVSRKLPPGRDALVTLAPGESKAQEILLREPIVPLAKVRERGGGKARVVARGAWKAVWLGKTGEQVGEEALGRMEADGGSVGGGWETEDVEVVV